jgi:hypothetical protein
LPFYSIERFYNLSLSGRELTDLPAKLDEPLI